MINALKNTSVQTFLVVFFVFLFGTSMPLDFARVFYTLSLALKDLLLFILPFAVCVFIASTLNNFEKRGWLLVVALVFFEIISNSCASFAAYGLSFWGASLYEAETFAMSTSPLMPFEVEGFNLSALRPSFWRVEYGTAFGVILGLCMPYMQSTTLEKTLSISAVLVKNIFIKGFAKIIPLFVLGFFVNLVKTGDFSPLLLQSGKAISIMIMGVTGYVIILYLIVGWFSIKRTAKAIQNVLPAGLIAFSSMSSVAAMPITIQATEKNLKNPSFASMVIPATTNIQQVGDCFIQVFLCCMILSVFGQNIPNLNTFVLFLSVFVMARFTTAAVIGGAIFIMLPLYQTYLGFNEEMIAMLLMFNMILDPIVTSSNVMANSALCVLFERFWEKISLIKSGNR
ncbi:MAG: cation:dicarboxylase symporter family transporter [Acinetobacter sp.]|uniref:cation:dicarboxylate symporter family transporter n=1 Tax=Acinetobacter sp. TaxID=472 RepID=UPI000FADEDEC|nr:cation:dicarboxylase symporter family transporter [Acinetobacter sp.]RUP36999.1 MAG: cation:dicarboxylase symporter family transporter [Acinetobacter sp.]